MKRILRAVTLLTLLSSATLFGWASAAITIAEVHTNVSCNGGNDGSIQIAPTGGSSPYTYNWGGGVTNQNRTGLSASTYSVIVTDNAGVTSAISVNITQPSPFIITSSITGENCGGQNVGSVTLTVNGSTPGYTFLWSNGATTQNLSNLYAAVYYVTVTDSRSCTATDSANVTQPTGVGITTVVTDITCSLGMNNGAIAVTVQYGNPGYTYLWNDGATTQNRSGLMTGNYTLTVTDAIGCSASALATVGQLPGGMSINSSTIPPTCNGGNNGSILINSVVGSTGPYTFLWNDASVTQNRSGISAGTYAVTATSSTGCTASASIVLGQPASITVTTHAIGASCYGVSNGAITSSAGNGTSPYTYAWSGGYTTSNIFGLAAGTYAVTVTDFKGCTVTATALPVTQPTQIIVSATSTALGCSGGATGSVTTSVSNGASPYSYWWGGGVVSADRTNVGAGIYNVTVTDAHGCTATTTATISAYTPMSLSAATVDNLCYGDTVGTISEIAHNGTGPYHYIWSTGDTTAAIGSLRGGIYTVTITDNAGCSLTQTSTIATPPFPIIVNSTISDVSCFGLSDGSIALNPVNGHPPYSYKWAGLGTTSSINNVVSGNYQVSISDSWGCTVTATFTVTQPGLITPVSTVTNVACYGGSTGAISLAVTGGFSPFSYKWNDGITTQTRASLSAGSYQVTIADNHACSKVVSVIITQPLLLTSAASGVAPVCFGASTGTGNITANGGTSPYSYNWGGGITAQNPSTLSAGTYIVTVTDANGCTGQSSVSLVSPPAISVTATGNNVACNGSNTGTIIINVSGGTSPYTYNWGGGITTQNRNNLATGSYTVTITDHAACTSTNTTIVGQSTNLAVSATATDATCFGSNNGAVTATASGGTTPYTYDWGGGITTSLRNNAAAGSYTVIVTDHLGCSVSASSVVGQPGMLSISSTTSPATCFGGSGGAIHITAAGGTGAYTYNWGGGIVTQNRNNLFAGNYTLTVTDNAGCNVSSLITVVQPAQVALASTQTNVSCNAGSDATIQLIAGGGTGAYTYNWGGGIVSANRTGLALGSYAATVTDANGCSATHVTIITQPAALAISPAITHVACFGQTTGAIALTVSGGTGAYTYNWGGVATQNRTGLSAGTYRVTVTDSNGCSLSASAVVTQSQQITTSISSITNANCYGATNGGINIHINGGTPSFTYLWSNGSTSQSLSGVAAGTYHLSVSDAYGCTTSTSINITQPSRITYSSIVTNVLCGGDATGAIATIVNGGNGGFNYLWSNGATTGNITNLIAGSYTLSLTDVQNCSASFTTQVNQPTPLVLASAQSNVSCGGGNTGSATIQAIGGTGASTYNWSNGQTTAQINQLNQGTYNVTVKDANACSVTSAINITQLNSIIVGLTPANVVCAGQSNGSIQTNVSGGAGGYQYTWTNGATTTNISGLSAGHYAVTITDANSCNTSASASISQPAAISITQQVTNAVCFGTATGSIQLTNSGGTGSYQYLWSNGATVQNIANLNAGNYSVTVKDANGCSVTGGRSVSQPMQLVVNLNANDVSCNGGSNASVNTTSTGGNGTYNYTWSNGATTANLISVQAGTYSITVKDVSNCSVTGSISVAQPAAIVVQSAPVNVSCNAGNDGSVGIQVSGGAGGYTYNWSNQSTAQQLSGLSAGAYGVTVRDANLCSVVLSLNITQPAPLRLANTHADYACSNKAGSIQLTTTGGTAPYAYHWQDGPTSQNRTGLAAAGYVVTVTDQHLCAQSTTVAVAQLSPMAIAVTQSNVSCFGGNNGAVTLNVSGGTLPYLYRWNNAATTSSIQQLAAGTYSAVVTDANGCPGTAGTSISQPSAIQLASTIGSVNCIGNNNGSVSTVVSGGTAPYTYQWNNNNTTSGLANLVAGAYQLTVTDANSCKKIVQNITVTQPSQIVLTSTVTSIGCSGLSDGSAAIATTGGTPPYSYNWSTSAKTTSIDSLAAGSYSVTITDNNGCLMNKVLQVTSSAPLLATSAVQNTSCKEVSNGSISLTVSGGTLPYHYNWSNGEATSAATSLTEGNYVVTVTDAKGCSVEAGGNIIASYELSIHAAASAAITSGAPVQLTVSANTDHGNTYNWTPSGVLTCSTCANTEASIQQNTLFTVYAVDVNGCKAVDTISVQGHSVTDIFIPNAFTPNSDGVNDQFKIFGDLGNVYFMDVAVFDRWGEKVFESNNPNFEWDGTYRGEPAPIGVYIYTATAAFSNGTHRDFKGSVTLMR